MMDVHTWFNELDTPREHPRFVMQHRRHRVDQARAAASTLSPAVSTTAEARA